MLTQLNLNRSPYWDDYNALKQYYAILFKPGFAVQTRELNQIQSIQQNQIESFADNIFKKGTIVDGCNFTYFNDYQYVKLVDTTLDGFGTVPGNYVGYFAENDAQLKAFIINSVDGFEASDPDLKTIYVTYINAGNTGNIHAFSAGETLTIRDANNSIPSVDIVAGGVGFSNSDVVVALPAIRVRCTSGAFSNGDNLIQVSTGANVEVVTATPVDGSTTDYVLSVKPRNADLSNSAVNAVAWTITLSEDVTNPANTIAATVVDSYGTDFEADIITNGVGKILDVAVINRGQNFLELPYITVQSPGNLTGINAIDLRPKNYFAKVKVSTSPEAIGAGYAFAVSEGVIYQKGYFTKVLPQTVIVDKYSNSPNNVVVGFDTREEVVTSDIDPSLLDNALGSENETAPGADRLKLTPVLMVLNDTDAAANSDFTSLVLWSEGNAVKQTQQTQYSTIGDQMAQQVFDQSGNFVVDTFQIATQSNANNALEGNTYTVVVDPGQAYISGYMTQTLRNYYIDVKKGSDTQIANNFVSLNYGNYININQVGGLFQFSTGANVDFYDTSKRFLSNTALIAAGNTVPQGNKIGTARIRSMVSDSGFAGDPQAQYRLYLFDIAMNAGKKFSSVRSVFFNGASANGIADVILTQNPTTGSNDCILQSPTNDGLIFSAGVESLKNSNGTSYTYRTIDQTTTFANNGVLTKSIASNPNEFYPYTGNLTPGQLQDLYVVPIGNTLYQYTSLEGNVTTNATSNVVVGDANCNFFSAYAPGDYTQISANATTSVIKKVSAVLNTTAFQVDSVLGFDATNCSHKRVFPKNVPIPFGTRAGLTGNVDVNMNVLKLGLHHANGANLTINGTATVNTAIGCNILRSNITSTEKTANRTQYVKIHCSNNAGGTNGPWCLGVPDIFRFRRAFVGNSSVNTSSTNITAYMYIDHNQNANYLDHGWLMINPRKPVTFQPSDYILVEFDYFSRSDDGYFDTVSYTGTANQVQIDALNSLPLANLTSKAASLEVPEVYTQSGNYYDLLNNFDFRPAVTATVSPSSDPASAPLNPASTRSFGNTADPANDKKFPLPDSSMATKVEHYLGRVDSVFIAGRTGQIYVLKGIPDVDPRKRFPANHPKDTLQLQQLTVPAYPNVTDNPSVDATKVFATGVYNERSQGTRLRTHTITPILSSYEFQLSQPMVYTNEDIANLERRIKDLEYYNGLTILETSITNKIIPSSVDGSLNRFKFGFFADDFSTDIYSDFGNPQYAASIEVEGTTSYGQSKNPLETNQNWADSDQTSPTSTVLSPVKLIQKSTNRIVPPKFIWTVPHTIKNLPYIDEVCISQDYATNNPGNNVIIDGGCIPKTITEIVPATNGYYFTSSARFNNFAGVVLSSTVQLGDKSGGVTIYFNNDTSAVQYDVYKGTTLVATTNAASATVQNLSATNQTFLDSTANKTGFVSKPYANFTRNGDAVKGSGKLTFSHNPSTGVKYTIVTTVKSGAFWEYLVEYPVTTPSTTSTIVDPCVIVNEVTNITSAPPQATTYTGTLQIPPQQSGTAWSCSKNFVINGIALAGIVLTATGLKPNTIHDFYIDGVLFDGQAELLPQDKWLGVLNSKSGTQYNSLLKSYLQSTGKTPLLSDPEGKLTFAFWERADSNGNAWIIAVLNQAGLSNDNRGKSYGSSGYSTLMLSARNSIATKLVAQRKPGSIIPWNMAGNP